MARAARCARPAACVWIGAEPDLTASIVADKLELFASPDRNLSLSGSASVANGGAQGGMAINGKFVVDHALFDLPEQSAPTLGDDVVIVRPDGTVAGETAAAGGAARTSRSVRLRRAPISTSVSATNSVSAGRAPTSA